MSLPKVLPAHPEIVDVGGQIFEVRGLTRGQAARFKQMVDEKAPLSEIEILVLSYATDTPIDEVREWYEKVEQWVVEELSAHIRRVSRLDEGAQKSG